MVENLNTAKELSGETVTFDYAGLNVELPVEYANDPVLKEKALAKVRNSSDFDEIIDRTTGASTFVRTLAPPSKSSEDRLATIRKYYPDAVKHGEDNFLFTNPETGKPTLFDETRGGILGIQSAGDITQYGREVAKIGGGILGLGSSVAGAIPTGGSSLLASSAVAAAGSTTAGYAYDVLIEALGGVDTRNATERAFDLALGFGAETVGGAVGSKVLTVAGKGAKKILGGATTQSKKIYDLMVNYGITPTGGAITGGRGIGRLEAGLDAHPFSATTMKNKIEEVISTAQSSAYRVAQKVGKPKTQQEVGVNIQDSASRAMATFRKEQKAIETKLANAIGAETPFFMNNTRQLLSEFAIKAKDNPLFAKKYSEFANDLNSVLKQNPQAQTIPYSTLREARTIFGEITSDKLESTSRQKLANQVYGALTQDISENAERLGVKGAWEKTNKFTRDFMQKNGQFLDKIIQTDAPEKVYRTLLNGRKDGGTYIEILRKEFNDEEWNQILPTILKKMGHKNLGNEADDTFSFVTYITNYRSFSEEAKKAFFGKNTAIRKDLDNLTTIFSSMEQNLRLKNFSNTASVAHTLNIFERLLSTPTKIASTITKIGASALTPNLIAKLVTNPKFVKWLAQPEITKSSQIGQRIGQLSVIANENPEISEEIRQFLLSLTANDGNKE